jgi:hypothetical protein
MAEAKKQCKTMLNDVEQLREYTLSHANYTAAQLLLDAKQKCTVLEAEAMSQAQYNASEKYRIVQCKIEKALTDGNEKLQSLLMSISLAEARSQHLIGKRQHSQQLKGQEMQQGNNLDTGKAVEL